MHNEDAEVKLGIHDFNYNCARLTGHQTLIQNAETLPSI